MNNDILNEFHQLYSRGSIEESIDLLSTVDPARYSNKVKKRFAEPDFLDSLVANPSTFQHIFQSKYSDELLHEYFQRSKSKHSDFEAKLISEFPDVYIQAVRVNQVFLREDRIEELLAIESEPRFKVHQRVWSFLYDEKKRILNNLSSKLNAIGQLSLSEVLIDMTIWLESQRMTNPSIQNVHHLASTYSKFICLYFRKNPSSHIQLSIDEFQIKFTTKVSSDNTINVDLTDLLIWVAELVSFDENVLSLYSYDMNIDTIEEDGTIYLKQTKESYYKWKLDDYRYDVNGNIYMSQLEPLLDDLCVENLIHDKEPIPSVEIFKSLKKLSSDTLHSYGQTMRSIYLLETKSTLKSRIMAVENTKDWNVDALVSLFSVKKPSLRYDVWKKPFLKLGEILFCPTMFVANNDWFYGSAMTGLENLNYNDAERNRTSAAMEIRLGNIFSSEKWKVKVINDKDANQIDGDVDVIVDDGDTVLLIQLKRTYLRLNSKDAYYESINVDRKVAQQLNDAQKYFTGDNDIYNLKSRVSIKWIVTTSYEGILSEIDGCVKVNYFDLLHVIRNVNTQKISDLMDYIMTDAIIENYIGLPEIDTTNHKQALFST